MGKERQVIAMNSKGPMNIPSYLNLSLSLPNNYLVLLSTFSMKLCVKPLTHIMLLSFEQPPAGKAVVPTLQIRKWACSA